MVDETNTGPAAGGADDAAAIWNEIEQAEKGSPPDQGRETGADDAKPDEQKPPADTTTTDKPEGDKPAGEAKAGSDQPASDKKDDKTAADKAAADIWANVPPEIKAAHEAALKRNKDLEHEASSNRGRIAAYQRRVSELEAGKGAAPAKAAAPEKSGDDKGAPKAAPTVLDKPAFKKFKEEYPEVAAPLEEIIADLHAQNTTLAKELGGISADRREANLAQQENVLAAKHTDWQAVTGSKGFSEWLAGQPAYVQEAAIRNGQHIVDGEEAAHIVGLYKLSTGLGTRPADKPSGDTPGTSQSAQPDKRKLQLEGAAAPKGKTPARVASGIPEDGDPKEIWDAFERQEKQRA